MYRKIVSVFSVMVLSLGVTSFGAEVDWIGSRTMEWKPMGCGMGGNSFWLTVDPSNDKTLYWSPDMGGLYKTIDGGKHWESVGAEFLHDHRGNATSLVTVAPSDSNIVYAFAQLRIADLPSDSPLVKQYGQRHLGLIQSQDGGETWRAIIGPAHRLGAIAIDPQDANTVWCIGPGFFAASTGVSYSRVYYEPGPGAMVMTSDNWKTSNVVYVGCKDSEEGANRQVAFGSIVVDPDSPRGNRTLYVCGNMGVMKSDDHGKTWKNANDGLDNTDAQMLAIHHDKKQDATTLYVTVRGGGGRGGVYKSIDGGESWNNVTADLPVKTNRGCRNIVIDNRDASTVYVGMSYKNGLDGGLFKTVDGGSSWVRITHPVGTQKNKDMENCWNQTSNDRVEGLAISQQNPDHLTYVDGNCRMFATVDGGNTWQQNYTNQIEENRFQTRGMEDTCTMGILVSPFTEGRVYISEHDFSGLSSFDGGESFYPAALTGVGGRCGWYSFAVDPDDPDFVCGGSNSIVEGHFHTSTDGGKTWDAGKVSPGAKYIPDSVKGEKNERYVNRYINSMVILNDKRTPSRIIITKKTGVFYSDDRGASWSRSVTGIEPEDDFAFYRLYTSKRHPKRVYAVAGLMPNDKFTDYNRHGTATSNQVEKMQGGLYRSDDEGQTWQHISTNFAEANASAIAFDQHDESIIYMSVLSWFNSHGSANSKFQSPGGLYKSTDGGVTWENLVTCRSRVYSGLADVAVNNEGTIYTAGREFPGSSAMGGVYRSADGGKSWQDITGKAAIERYTRIVVDPFNPRKLYLGTFGAGAFVGIDSSR